MLIFGPRVWKYFWAVESLPSREEQILFHHHRKWKYVHFKHSIGKNINARLVSPRPLIYFLGEYGRIVDNCRNMIQNGFKKLPPDEKRTPGKTQQMFDRQSFNVWFNAWTSNSWLAYFFYYDADYDLSRFLWSWHQGYNHEIFLCF